MTACEKLGANRLFKGLPRDALQPVYERGVTLKVQAGDVLIREGQTNKHLYLVLDGEVEVRLPDSPERFTAVRLGTRGPGSCLGEYALIDKRPASATVVATQPSELFKISHETLYELLKTNHVLGSTVYRNLLLHLVDRLRATDAELDLFRPL